MMRSEKLTVGLTGGIASGKSYVADCFAELGAGVVDTDVIAREVVQPGAPALEEIREAFGSSVITDGGLNRQAMREIVFADDDKRRMLEAILHPRIRVASFDKALQSTNAYVIIVVPLLFESPMRNSMDRIVVVDCREETQLDRLMARDSESEEQGRRIMATQATREERLSIADDVIDNDGSQTDTRVQVQDLHNKYLAIADDHQ